MLGATLVGDGKVAAQVVGELLGGLGAAHVRGDHDGVVPVEVLVLLEVVAQQEEGGEVGHRHVEEALDLALVQVDGDDLVHAGGLQQVGHQTGGDGLAGGSLAVLAGIAVVRDDRDELAAAGALGGVADDEGLHQQVVNVGAGEGLDEVDVVAADGLGEAGVDLAVGELLDVQALQLKVQDVGDLLGQGRIAGARVELDLLVDGHGVTQILVHLRPGPSSVARASCWQNLQLYAARCAR